MFGINVPEEYGGAGETSYKFESIIMEETARAGVTFGAAGIHVNLVRPYLLAFASEEQKRRWMPGYISGEMMGALAMTEPGTGSDLAGIATTAKLSADGTHYVLNGAKTFISGGVLADRVLVVARTSPATPENRRGGLSILFVDTKTPGYTVGKKLDKIGLKTSDTAELAFQDVKVPVEDLLGEEGQAFKYLTHNLVEERLAIIVGSTAQAGAAIRFAVDYVKERKAFGQPVASFQNTKFVLADCESDYQAAQALTDRAIELFDQGKLTRPTPPPRRSSPPRRPGGSSTSACSCTAATATSTSTRSPGCTPTRACPGSTAAPRRSCARSSRSRSACSSACSTPSGHR